jgi:hypothetical protein
MDISQYICRAPPYTEFSLCWKAGRFKKQNAHPLENESLRLTFHFSKNLLGSIGSLRK